MAARAGWALAPDIKDDIGALRDLHVLYWLGRVVGQQTTTPELSAAGDLLLAVREALHAEVKRKSDRIRIDLQDAVARPDGPRIRRCRERVDVRGPFRRTTHRARLVDRTERTGLGSVGGAAPVRVARQLTAAVRLEDGALHVDERIREVGGDQDAIEVALELLSVFADSDKPISPRSLMLLRATFQRAPVERWSRAALTSFLPLLDGTNSTEALEVMDHVGAWPVLLPELGGIRGLAQHDPYHRYTVDGHSFLAVGEARRATEEDSLGRSAGAEAGDLAALFLAALMHDIGKGSGEDHSVAGERIARRACQRMGLDETRLEDVVALVRHHLLLVDTATRRDLDDGAVISMVAETIGTPRRLRLLYLLSVADGHATGPEGWNDWKGALVRELYLKVMNALETGELPARSDVAARAREVEAYEPALAGRAQSILQSLPPSYLSATSLPDVVDDVRLLLSPPKPGQVKHRVDEATEAGQLSVTVCVIDRPGTLARTAGVLALNRASVLTANAFATTDGFALQRFIVKPTEAVSWDSFGADLDAAYSGRLAIEARLGKKVLDYKPAAPIVPEVRVLQDESAHSTVVEVRAPDALGLLWAIAASLSELDLDIHVAKIDTLGQRVVDVFYVRSAWGEKLNDAQAGEVRHAIEHRVTKLFGP